MSDATRETKGDQTNWSTWGVEEDTPDLKRLFSFLSSLRSAPTIERIKSIADEIAEEVGSIARTCPTSHKSNCLLLEEQWEGYKSDHRMSLRQKNDDELVVAHDSVTFSYFRDPALLSSYNAFSFAMHLNLKQEPARLAWAQEWRKSANFPTEPDSIVEPNRELILSDHDHMDYLASDTPGVREVRRRLITRLKAMQGKLPLLHTARSEHL